MMLAQIRGEFGDKPQLKHVETNAHRNTSRASLMDEIRKARGKPASSGTSGKKSTTNESNEKSDQSSLGSSEGVGVSGESNGAEGTTQFSTMMDMLRQALDAREPAMRQHSSDEDESDFDDDWEP